jgi:hypothetical protein
MTGKTRYSRLAGYVFWRVQITTGKNYNREKKGTVVWPMEAAQIWREIYDRKKKGTVVWPAIFFWRVQITTGKIYDREKKGTVVWPMEVAKKRHSCLAISWKLEKIMSGKKRCSHLVVGWMEHKTQNTTHIIDSNTKYIRTKNYFPPEPKKLTQHHNCMVL